MNITLRVGRRLSRALTVTGAAALIGGLGLVAIAPGAIADEHGDVSTGNPNGDCPDGTVFLAKYEWNGSEFVAAEGGDIVTSVTGDTTSGSFVVADDYEVTVVIVKGGTDVEVDTDGDNTFTSDGLENDGGQTPAISNVQFCGPVPSTTTSTTPTDTGSTTPSTTTSTTPSETTSTTPTDTGSTTPSETTSTTPTDTGSTTPSETTSTTPTDTGSTTSTTTQPATTTTTSASVLPTVVTSTPAASTTPAVQPAVLARTGIETWTVALVAGLLLLGGGAMVALGTGAAPRTRRH